MSDRNHQIVLLAVEDFQSLDLFGPLDAFHAARELAGAGYAVNVAGFENRPIATESGTQVLPHDRLDRYARIDTLVVCGGRGARCGDFRAPAIGALRNAATRAKRVASICTGAFLLARTGLADGRRVATHWRYAAELARRHPEVEVDAESIFLRDGKFWSSAGVTAGIDLTLALIGEDHGRSAAASVARQLVVYLSRPGNQAQYSVPLSAQFGLSGRFGELLEWITNNLSKPMPIDSLAERVAVTPRHFARLFHQAFGQPPGRFIENLRLDQARLLLADQEARVEDVGRRVGYNSGVSFRRAFERRFAMTPTQYRARFAFPVTRETAE